MRRGIGIVRGGAQARLMAIAGAAAPALVALASVGALMAPAALAKEPQEYYQGSHFTPQITVGATTSQAGAHPDISIRVKKHPSQCPGQVFAPYAVGSCADGEAYIEQDLKDMRVNLPPGLLANVNAVPTCDLGVWGLSDRASEWPEWGVDEIPCGPSNQVGVITFRYPYVCSWSPADYYFDRYACGNAGVADFLGSLSIAGKLYNAPPGPGEQAHLYALVGPCLDDSGKRWIVLYPRDCDPTERALTPLHRVDTAIRIRTESDWGVDAVTEDLIDALCRNPYNPHNPGYSGCPPLGNTGWVPYPPDDFTFTLWGAPGGESGPALTLNPTSCQPRSTVASFTGYAQNTWDANPAPYYSEWRAGEGTGLGADSSAPYPVTGCNSLDYSPEVELTLDNSAPKTPAAITSVVTQGIGEQTTKQVTVDIPRSFKVNLQNTLSQCSDEQAASLSCPEEAKVGEVEAESNLLPETGELAGPLRGAVYVGPTSTENIRLFTILHGFVDAKIEGRLEMHADGSSRAVFDLPEIPQQKITLTLYGGAQKALVTTPKACGTYHLKAGFTSHQGTVAKRDVPVSVSCTDPAFDVDLGSRRPGAHPTLTLTARSAGLESVAFELSRQLKIARHPARLAALGRYGTLHLDTEDGLKELKVKLLKAGTLGSLSFSATEGRAQATSLGAYDISVAARGKRSVLKRKRKGKRVPQGPTRIWIGRLPAGTTQVSLELQGQKDDLIQNPRRCKVRGKRLKLGFSARIVGTDASRTAIPRSVSMSCKKSRAGRRK